MFTHPISSPNTQASPFGAGGNAAPPGSSFEATLAGAASSQPASGAFGAQKPDPVDEEKALRELFHILALLSVGQVDYGALAKCDGASGAPPGPRRMEVEALKQIIQRILRGGGAEELEIDPKTGKPTVHGTRQTPSSEVSLNALFNSLPSEIQNLLRRAFPDLDQLLLDEQRAKTGNRTATAGSTVDPSASQVGIEGTSLFLAKILDASNPASKTRVQEPLAKPGSNQ